MAQITPLVVNGEAHELALDPATRLLEVVRDELGFTGPKGGCYEGECGACTVLVDGEPVHSCVTSLGEVAGRSVTTVEGLAEHGRLHPVQQGFLEELGFQCGFCTAGMITRATALLAEHPKPSDDEIRAGMAGNVCRCCAYPRIERSVRRAAELMASQAAEPKRESAGASRGAIGAEGAPVPVPTVAGWLPRPRRPWDLEGTASRNYFEVLGDGLVTVLPPAEARRNVAGGPFMENGGAWIHVGADEVVTAFTGKVDFGQDNRTALSMLVAEELHVPPGAVRLVMGDTDVCPYDVGTFGSRSMPDAGSYLRSAAAAARETLARAAAERWGTERAGLTVADCRVVRPDGEAVSFAELLRGQRRVELVPLDEPLTPGTETTVSGTPVSKLTAPEIVVGARTYVSDMSLPDMLVGRVLRPPAFGSTLRSIDLSGARTMPGVVAVNEGDFVGVAAPSTAAARAAIGALRAEWRTPSQPGEGGIAEYLREHPIELTGWSGALDERGGDVDAALEEASSRLEASYTAAYIAHVPLETRAALARWEGERLTVWTGTQRPFGVRAQLAAALGVAEADVRVIVPDTGGGWGGKHTGEVAIEAARLARAAGKPVRVRWTREEEMTWAYFRPYAVIDVRAGTAADGRLVAWEFTNVNSGPNAILTPYEVANFRIRYQPADSPLRTGSYRALAATANTFARESAMDELARAVGLDPLEFRLRNLRDDRLATVLRAAAEQAGWGSRPGTGDRPLESGYGMGIAGSIEKGARIATVAEVRVHPDRRLELLRLVSAFECGEIVNPENLRNQIEGAACMGLGGALFEAIHFENGQILNSKLSQYRVPRITDVPPIEVVLVDRRDLPSQGAGETPMIAIAPAIANAICEATGSRLRSMPLVPDGVVA